MVNFCKVRTGTIMILALLTYIMPLQLLMNYFTKKRGIMEDLNQNKAFLPSSLSPSFIKYSPVS